VYRSSEAARGACKFLESGVVDNLELCEYRWGSKRGSYLIRKGLTGDATRRGFGMGVVDGSNSGSFSAIVVDRCIRWSKLIKAKLL
jgi:hypothetical protein